MLKRTKKVMKKLPKKVIAITLVFAIVFSYFLPISNVLANNKYGEGEHKISLDITNNNNFTINSVTINAQPWTTPEDEYFSDNNQYHIVINVSGNEETGDKIPMIGWGGNWNGEDGRINSSVHGTETGYEFALDLNVTSNQTFVGLFIEENMDNGVAPGPEPGEEPRFDGKAYVLWSCESGICYHYFEDIPNFENGDSKFYKASEVTADNNNAIKFDVNAQYRGWYTKEGLETWIADYELATGHEVNWVTLNPEVILGEPEQNIDQYEPGAIADGCERPAQDAHWSEWNVFESCVNHYAAKMGKIWTHQLRPVGEPSAKNAYVSYGDRNFKVIIYNSDYKGISTTADFDGLNYYPISWGDPFTRTDQYDVSETDVNHPAYLESILLEDTVNIDVLQWNDYQINTIEALDVPEDAVTITKVNNRKFKIVFSSNFYDHVVFKITDTKGEESYIQIKRYAIDGWIRDDSILSADFYYDKNDSYEDFIITAKVIYNDGTVEKVTLEAVETFLDALGNPIHNYEADQEESEGPFKGKGLKQAVFEYNLGQNAERRVKDIYLNAEYKGSNASTYAGAYSGSGEGTPANLFHPEGGE